MLWLSWFFCRLCAIVSHVYPIVSVVAAALVLQQILSYIQYSEIALYNRQRFTKFTTNAETTDNLCILFICFIFFCYKDSSSTYILCKKKKERRENPVN